MKGKFDLCIGIDCSRAGVSRRRAGALDAHPSRGASWEGFVAEDILRRERIARRGFAEASIGTP